VFRRFDVLFTKGLKKFANNVENTSGRFNFPTDFNSNVMAHVNVKNQARAWLASLVQTNLRCVNQIQRLKLPTFSTF